MDAAQNTLSVSYFSLDQGNMVLSGNVIHITEHPESAVLRGKVCLCLTYNVALMDAAVVLKVLYGNEGKAVFLCKLEQIRSAHHVSVFRHNLTAHPALGKAGKPEKVHGCLRVAVSDKHPTSFGNERKSVSGTPEISGNGCFIGALSYGQSSLCGRDSGCCFLIIHAHGKGRLVIVRVLCNHGLKVEAPGNLAAHGCADKTLGQTCHEVYLLRVCKLSRTDKISLILPVRVIGNHYHFPCSQVIKRFFYGIVIHQNPISFR